MRTITVPQLSFKRPSKKTLRRMLIAFLIVLLLHLFFLFVVAPHISFKQESHSRTEVIQINPQELKAMKQRIQSALMQQELREQDRVKEAPKDATMIGAFNQKVREQMTADSHAEDPAYNGGGSGVKPKPIAPPANLKLSNLGLGTTVPKPVQESQQEQAQREQAENTAPPSPIQGPAGPYHPRGLEDKRIKKGNQNLLDAVESEYYSFITRFEEPIVRNWYFLMRSNQAQIIHELQARNKVGSDVTVVIEFIIDRQGNFRSIDVVEPSGVPTLDNATREAIRKLGSIPNPPAGIFEGEPYFTRRLAFMVRVDQSAAGMMRPDIYW